MENPRLLIDLLLILSVAFALGAIMQRFRQPVVLGYLLAGLVLGPGTPGPTVEAAGVELMANIGVTLLMFSLGVQFSFQDLYDLRRVVSWGGGTQVFLTLGVSAGLLYFFGLSFPVAFLIGAAIAISSSTVALKLMQLRGELDQPHSRVTLGVSLAQDLSVVPLLALLPALAGTASGTMVGLIQSMGLAILVLGTLWVLGLRLVPWALFQVAQLGSRELFLATIVLIAFGVAFFSDMAGLSLAFGAFLAGVVVSESEFSHQVLGEIIPLRDIFAIVFFASIGLLFQPTALIDDWQLIAGMLFLIVVVKVVISGLSVRMLGYSAGTAAAAGILLGQIGEFSFIIAGQGMDIGIIDDRVFNAILAGAIGSLLLNPVLLSFSAPFGAILERIPTLGTDRQARVDVNDVRIDPDELRNHVIVAGYGRVGRELVRALRRRDFRFVIIDIDPTIVRMLREQNLPAVYGDISNDSVLEATGIDRARVFAVTVPDLISAQVAIRNARRRNESINVIARAMTYDQIQRLDEAGAKEVVQPAFEVGLEFVRHTLHRLGVSLQEIQAQVSSRRLDYYDVDRQDDDLP